MASSVKHKKVKMYPSFIHVLDRGSGLRSPDHSDPSDDCSSSRFTISSLDSSKEGFDKSLKRSINNCLQRLMTKKNIELEQISGAAADAILAQNLGGLFDCEEDACLSPPVLKNKRKDIENVENSPHDSRSRAWSQHGYLNQDKKIKASDSKEDGGTPHKAVEDEKNSKITSELPQSLVTSVAKPLGAVPKSSTRRDELVNIMDGTPKTSLIPKYSSAKKVQAKEQTNQTKVAGEKPSVFGFCGGKMKTGKAGTSLKENFNEDSSDSVRDPSYVPKGESKRRGSKNLADLLKEEKQSLFSPIASRIRKMVKLTKRKSEEYKHDEESNELAMMAAATSEKLPEDPELSEEAGANNGIGKAESILASPSHEQSISEADFAVVLKGGTNSNESKLKKQNSKKNLKQTGKASDASLPRNEVRNAVLQEQLGEKKENLFGETRPKDKLRNQNSQNSLKRFKKLGDANVAKDVGQDIDEIEIKDVEERQSEGRTKHGIAVGTSSGAGNKLKKQSSRKNLKRTDESVDRYEARNLQKLADSNLSQDVGKVLNETGSTELQKQFDGKNKLGVAVETGLGVGSKLKKQSSRKNLKRADESVDGSEARALPKLPDAKASQNVVKVVHEIGSTEHEEKSFDDRKEHDVGVATSGAGNKLKKQSSRKNLKRTDETLDRSEALKLVDANVSQDIDKTVNVMSSTKENEDLFDRKKHAVGAASYDSGNKLKKQNSRKTLKRTDEAVDRNTTPDLLKKVSDMNGVDCEGKHGEEKKKHCLGEKRLRNDVTPLVNVENDVLPYSDEPSLSGAASNETLKDVTTSKESKPKKQSSSKRNLKGTEKSEAIVKRNVVTDVAEINSSNVEEKKTHQDKEHHVGRNPTKQQEMDDFMKAIRLSCSTLNQISTDSEIRRGRRKKSDQTLEQCSFLWDSENEETIHYEHSDNDVTLTNSDEPSQNECQDGAVHSEEQFVKMSKNSSVPSCGTSQSNTQPKDVLHESSTSSTNASQQRKRGYSGLNEGPVPKRRQLRNTTSKGELLPKQESPKRPKFPDQPKRSLRDRTTDVRNTPARRGTTSSPVRGSSAPKLPVTSATSKPPDVSTDKGKSTEGSINSTAAKRMNSPDANPERELLSTGVRRKTISSPFREPSAPKNPVPGATSNMSNVSSDKVNSTLGSINRATVKRADSTAGNPERDMASTGAIPKRRNPKEVKTAEKALTKAPAYKPETPNRSLRSPRPQEQNASTESSKVKEKTGGPDFPDEVFLSPIRSHQEKKTRASKVMSSTLDTTLKEPKTGGLLNLVCEAIRHNGDIITGCTVPAIRKHIKERHGLEPSNVILKNTFESGLQSNILCKQGNDKRPTLIGKYKLSAEPGFNLKKEIIGSNDVKPILRVNQVINASGKTNVSKSAGLKRGMKTEPRRLESVDSYLSCMSETSVLNTTFVISKGENETQVPELTDEDRTKRRRSKSLSSDNRERNKALSASAAFRRKCAQKGAR